MTYINCNLKYLLIADAQSWHWFGSYEGFDLFRTVFDLQSEIINSRSFWEMRLQSITQEKMEENNSALMQNDDNNYSNNASKHTNIAWCRPASSISFDYKFSQKLAQTENNKVLSKGLNDSQGDSSEYEKLWSHTNSLTSELQTNECKSSRSKDQDDCELEHKTFWAWGLSPNESVVWNKILTPNNIQYLEALKEFDYAIEERRKTAKSKMSFVFIWKHKDGWDKEFQRWWNLLDHCRTHKGIRPFKCGVWGKQFTQKGNLNKHLQIHSYSV